MALTSTKQLIRGGTGALAVQVCFAGLAFLNSVVLARLLGAAAYGAFANAMAWVTLLVIPASFGFATLLVREVALYNASAQWSRLRGIVRFSTLWVIGASVLLAVILAEIAFRLFPESDEAGMRHTMAIAAILVPLFALLQLRQATLRGLECILRARIPELVVRPLLLFILVVLLYFLAPKWLSAQTAMALNVTATAVALVLGYVWVRGAMPDRVRDVLAEFNTRTWLKSGGTMLVFAGAQTSLMQVDIVMLGFMRGATETGHYAVVNRLSYMLGYGMIAAEMVTAPLMARLYAAQDYEHLQHLLSRVVRIVLLILIPAVVVVAHFGTTILSLFGRGFESAYWAMLVLIIGRLFEVAIGSSPLLASMTGHERMSAIAFGGASVVNLGLNLILIPRLGAVGAAVSSMVSLVGAKGFLSIYLNKRMGIDTSVLSVSSWKTDREFRQV